MDAKKVPLGIAQTPLRDQIRDDIRQRITDGRLPPGGKMIERELAAELGVSRLPVREALRMLETEGFVEVIPRRGVVVRPLSREDVEELFDVRESLEVLAVRRATQRATTEQLASLERLLDRAAEASERGDVNETNTFNEAFHDTIIAMAHNRLLASMLDPLQGRLHWLFRQIDDPSELVAEHRDLYEAIASGDADLAAAKGLEHVKINRQVAVRLLFSEEECASLPAAGGLAPGRRQIAW